MKKENKKNVIERIKQKYFTSIIYVRCAQEEQSGDNAKINEQIEICKKYAKSKNYEINEDFICKEYGSGVKPLKERPELLKTLELIKKFPKNRFIIVVSNIFRISRNIGDLMNYYDLVDKRGSLVECCDISPLKEVKN